MIPDIPHVGVTEVELPEDSEITFVREPVKKPQPTYASGIKYPDELHTRTIDSAISQFLNYSFDPKAPHTNYPILLGQLANALEDSH